MRPEKKYQEKIAACLDEIRTMGLVPEDSIEVSLIVRDRRQPLAGNEVTNEAGVLFVHTGTIHSTNATLFHCISKHGKLS